MHFFILMNPGVSEEILREDPAIDAQKFHLVKRCTTLINMHNQGNQNGMFSFKILMALFLPNLSTIFLVALIQIKKLRRSFCRVKIVLVSWLIMGFVNQVHLSNMPKKAQK